MKKGGYNINPLNKDKIKNKEFKIISSKEALRDIIPFQENCEFENPIEGCCLCHAGHYKHYQYAPGYHIHYYEYCEIGRKGIPYGWWED